MAELTARRSTIFIAAGDGIQVFHSVNDVPPRLRRKLRETTEGANSATILIADRQGRQELVRALQGEPSSVQCRLADTIRARQQKSSQADPQKPKRSILKSWLALLVSLATCGSLWLLFELRF